MLRLRSCPLAATVAAVQIGIRTGFWGRVLEYCGENMEGIRDLDIIREIDNQTEKNIQHEM